jgi:hypothetical protein
MAGDGGEATAIPECIVSNLSHALGNNDRDDATTKSEHTAFDYIYAFGNIY